MSPDNLIYFQNALKTCSPIKVSAFDDTPTGRKIIGEIKILGYEKETCHVEQHLPFEGHKVICYFDKGLQRTDENFEKTVEKSCKTQVAKTTSKMAETFRSECTEGKRASCLKLSELKAEFETVCKEADNPEKKELCQKIFNPKI